MSKLIKNITLANTRRSLDSDMMQQDNRNTKINDISINDIDKNKTRVDLSNTDLEPSPSQNQNQNIEKPELARIFKDELETLKTEARDQGLLDAKKMIAAEIEEQVRQHKAQLDQDHQREQVVLTRDSQVLETLIKEISTLRKQKNIELEASMIRLSLACLYKLTGETKCYQHIIEHTINTSIADENTQAQVKIRLAREDLGIVAQLSKETKEQCQFIEDRQLQPGSCFIESGFSTLDMSVLAQVDQIRDALVETLQKRFTDND